jgi:hypothetical protein
VSAILHLGNWKKGWRASRSLSLSLSPCLHHVRVSCASHECVCSCTQATTDPSSWRVRSWSATLRASRAR